MRYQKNIEEKLGRKLTLDEIKEANRTLKKFNKAFKESDNPMQALKKLGFKRLTSL